MIQKVKYIMESEPAAVKKVADYVGGTALILLIIGDFLYSPLNSLPLELQVFAIGELIPTLFLEFNAIMILIVCLAFSLYFFRWRNGNVSVINDQIKIDGKVAVSILLSKVTEITFFDSDSYAGPKRTVQIKTADDRFKLKFYTDDIFSDFAEKLVLVVGLYDNIKIDTSILYSNDQ
jgi:hypothetical protein